ncbi:unnamed protein product [Trichogramma brassicae]|uniref:Uncharacterized protein n=1 Tax=Trichogramma brassicae TaxID=86971 RepID=A0A6H5J317_9HYME|nr:unnamed protein product [Trichogramma brassicae]
MSARSNGCSENIFIKLSLGYSLKRLCSRSNSSSDLISRGKIRRIRCDTVNFRDPTPMYSRRTQARKVEYDTILRGKGYMELHCIHVISSACAEHIPVLLISMLSFCGRKNYEQVSIIVSRATQRLRDRDEKRARTENGYQTVGESTARLCECLPRAVVRTPKARATRGMATAMNDGLQSPQGQTSVEKSDVPSLTERVPILLTRTSPSTIVKAISEKIIVAPLHCKEKDFKLPSVAEFATGTMEDKLERMDGLIRGLGQFI